MTAADVRLMEAGGRTLRVATWRLDLPSEHLPVLFFNGIGANIEAVAPLADALDDRGFVMFDMPGVGGSPEPTVPYNLAVMVANKGKGEARNVRIVSSQPQIIENEKGLAIEFKIIGTQVAGQDVDPSLTANFGAHYRYTGAALTSDLAWLIGAAFAPLVALGLCAHFGLAFVGVYLLSGAVCTLAALAVNRALKLRS